MSAALATQGYECPGGSGAALATQGYECVVAAPVVVANRAALTGTLEERNVLGGESEIRLGLNATLDEGAT